MDLGAIRLALVHDRQLQIRQAAKAKALAEHRARRTEAIRVADQAKEQQVVEQKGAGLIG